VSAIDLACAADSRYVVHSAAMIRSALELHGRQLRVHYLPGHDVSPSDAGRLAEMVRSGGGSIDFLEVDPARVRDLPSMGYISRTMWHRVFLPELMPDTERVLYLDADTIVMDSLEPLWELDLTDKLVGAVTNVFQRFVAGRREPFEIERSDPPYFNSGVLLLNLELMRSTEARDQLLAYARAHRDVKGWPDQDALNHVLGPARYALHPRWNVMNSFQVYPWSEDTFGREELAEALANPAIRHFEGPSINKPWHLLCERDMRELYRHFRRQTPWPRYLPEGLTPANLARRLARPLR
jgi:lipopolysaccharide biosynthesis glycosyltransferase